MKEVLDIEVKDPTVFLTTDVVYASRTEFCGGQYIPLKISLLRPRFHFDCDILKIYPTIVFLCGGGWSETDHNVWLPELAYFAKRGYAVASVQYPVTAQTHFPESPVAVKTAIRFLRANADKLRIDMDHVALMGESAGAYLTLLCASTEGKFEEGEYSSFASTVNAAVAFYPPISPNSLNNPGEKSVLDLPSDCKNYPSVLDFIDEKMVPTMILHGQKDDLVPVSHGRRIYERLQEVGVDSILLELTDANHADNKFFQPEVKEKILAFLDSRLK